METLKEQVQKYRQAINSPYTSKDVLPLIGTLIILAAIPLTIFLANQAREPASRAQSSAVSFLLQPAWTRSYNDSHNGKDTGSGVAIDSSKNIYAVGTVYNGSNYDIWLRKYNPSGGVLWTKTYNGPANKNDYGADIAVNSSGYIYVVGAATMSSTKRLDVWVRKYNSSGTVLWTRTQNGPANKNDQGQDIALDNSGNVYVIGFLYYPKEGNDIWVRKYTSAGTPVWSKKYTSPTPSKTNSLVGNNDKGYGIAATGAGSIYATGVEDRSAIGQKGNLWLAKISSAGKTSWIKRYNSPSNNLDAGHSVATDLVGNAYVAGKSFRKEGDGLYHSNAIIQMYNSAGTRLWQNVSSTTDNLDESAASVYVDKNPNLGNVFVIGQKEVSLTNKDVWLRVMTGKGSLLWQGTYNSPDSLNDSGADVVADKSDNTYVIGSQYRVGQGYDIWVRKYNNVDITSPTVSITSPADGSSVSGITNIAATASDNIGVTKVEFYVDGFLKGSDLSFPYTYAWNTRALSNGLHNVSAKAYDAAGNTGVSSTIAVTVSNVNLAPTLIILDPDVVGSDGKVTSADILAVVQKVGQSASLYPAYDLNANGSITQADVDIVNNDYNLNWPPDNLAVGKLLWFFIRATDPEGSSITYSMTGPSGATLNSITGEFKWTPSLGQAATTYFVPLRASDGVNTVTQTLTITVP